LDPIHHHVSVGSHPQGVKGNATLPIEECLMLVMREYEAFEVKATAQLLAIYAKTNDGDSVSGLSVAEFHAVVQQMGKVALGEGGAATKSQVRHLCTLSFSFSISHIPLLLSPNTPPQPHTLTCKVLLKKRVAPFHLITSHPPSLPQVLWTEKELRHLWCDGMTRMPDPEAQQLDEERFVEIAELHLVPKILHSYSQQMQKKIY
jgi:hypothetical protein